MVCSGRTQRIHHHTNQSTNPTKGGWRDSFALGWVVQDRGGRVAGNECLSTHPTKVRQSGMVCPGISLEKGLPSWGLSHHPGENLSGENPPLGKEREGLNSSLLLGRHVAMSGNCPCLPWPCPGWQVFWHVCSRQPRLEGHAMPSCHKAKSWRGCPTPPCQPRVGEKLFAPVPTSICLWGCLG